MKTKLTKIIALAIIGIFGLTMLNPTPTSADDACSQLPKDSAAWNAAGCGGGGDELPTVIANILNVIIGISGLISVAFIIIGGVQYMTSAGDAAKTKQAKNTILYAVIGLIICALAFAIVNWVILGLLNQKQ